MLRVSLSVGKRIRLHVSVSCIVFPLLVVIKPYCLEELIFDMNDRVVVLFIPYFFATSVYDTAFSLNESMIFANSIQSVHDELG